MNETHPSLEEILFNLAVQKSTPAERAAFLGHACRDNAALRAAVEDLLESHFGASGFLPPLASGPGLPEAPTVPAPAAEAPAEMIGRYKLLEKIGEGGFGEVWMAEQREPVKRRVALKILKPGMDSRQVVARFEAERQALAMMDHPHIAKIHDAGTTDSARPYFVMELVRGTRITDYCDQHQLTTGQRLDLFIKVCQAIQHAHQKGIIHRDIKPSNVLVTVNDGAPVPKVIDFGIAKATQQELTDKTVFTQFQQFIGTPAYISPEQAEMSSLDIDTRADIYSLGVLLYELLVGQTPFDAREMMQGGFDALRKIIREREPQRPSTRLNTLPGDARTTAGKRRQTDAGRLVHQLQGDLDWIVMKCLEKDRTRRYETANGLAADLRRHLDNEPVAARPPSLGYRVQKTVRRHRSAFATAGVVLVALFLGLGVSLWQAVQKTRALARMTDAEHAQSRSRAVAEAALTQEAEARRRVDELLEQEKAQRLLAEKRIYATDVHLAQLAIDRDNFVRARELLSRHYPRPGQTNRPGWEWRYLWQQSQPDAAMEAYRAPSDGRTHSDVSPDGRLLAVTRPDTGTASIDLVDITDLRNPRKAGGIASLQSNLVTAVAFSPRNGLLAHAEGRRSPDPDGATSTTLALHDATTGRTVGTITNLAGQCRSLVWSGDGRSFWTLLLSGSPPQARLCLWRVPDLTLAASITNVPDQKVIGRHPFATTSDARTIVVAAGSSALTAIDVATGATNWSIPSPHSYGFANVVLAPDDRTLFASEKAIPDVIRTFDLLTGKEMAPPLECGENGGLSLAVAPDGRTLVSSSPEKLLRVWDVSDRSQGPKALPPLRGLPSVTWSVHFLPDATKLLTHGLDGTVLAWDLTRDRRPRYPLVVPFDHAVVRYQIGTDSHTLWIAKTNGIVSQRSGDAFQSETVLFNLGRKLADAQFSEDGRWFAAGSTRGTVEVWNVAERRRLHEFGSYGGRVEAVQFSQDGARLIVLDLEGATYAEWDLATSKQIRSFPALDPRRRGQRRSLSRDGRILLTLQQSGTFTRMETRTLEQRAGDSGLPNAVSVAFTPDGGHFAISSFNGSAKVFDTETLEPVAILGGDAYYIAAHFLDQGGRLMLAGDRTRHAVGVWDVGTRLELVRLEAEGFHRGLGASPDGNLLVAGVEETLDEVKELRLWRAPSWEEIQRAEAARPGAMPARRE